MAESEKLTAVKWALQHPDASLEQWMKFSRSQRHLRVRANNNHGFVELSFYEGQWIRVVDFVNSYKNMSLTRLIEEWNRAICLFPQEELLSHLHLTTQVTHTEVTRSSQPMTAVSYEDSRSRIRDAIHSDLMTDSLYQSRISRSLTPAQQEAESYQRQKQEAIEQMKNRLR